MFFFFFFLFFFHIENGIFCIYLNTLHVKENRKDIPIFPPDLALRLRHISSNYPCLEHIFMVPKVFEPTEVLL